MAFFKIVYVFRSIDGGWTEIFYDEAGSIDVYGPPPASEKAAVLNWRGSGVVLQALKIVEEGGLRRSKIFKINAQSANTSPDQGKDVAGVSAKIRLNFTGGGGRTLEVRGMPDTFAVPNSSGAMTVSPAGNASFNAYINWIKLPSNPYLGKRLVSIALNPWKNAVSLAPDPDNSAWTKVTISAIGAPVPNGSLVYFRGVSPIDLPWIKGIYRTVGQSTVTAFSIPTQYRETTSPTALRNVQWRQALYEYPPIESGNFSRFGTRDTAGPFRESRGSRKALRVR